MREEAPLSAASLSLGADVEVPFRARWLAALALLAAAASLFLVESLYAAMDRNLHFALAPAFFQWDGVARAGVAGERGDRLDPERTNAPLARDMTHIGQLTASGLSVRPFTHVVARLADVPVAPASEQPSDSPPPFAAGSLSFPATDSTAAGGSSASADEDSGPGAPLGEPINVTPVPSSAPGPDLKRRAVVARPGDRLAAVLSALGMDGPRAETAAALFAAKTGISSFAGGEKIMVAVAGPGGAAHGSGIQGFSVERAGAPTWTAARADDGSFEPVVVRKAAAPAGASRGSAAGASADLRETDDQSVEDSIHGLAKSDGVDRALLDEVIRLGSHDFDLDQPVSADDKIDFLYTKGDLNEPQLRFLRLTIEGRTQSYYRFTAPDDESVDYYDEDGRSVTKFLLRKPVPNGKLNDGFGWRIHPILKVPRFHEGVDYDAPMGAPIEAAGAGVVEKISDEIGYGRYIRVRHDLGYETTYAHIEGVARGVHVGTRVRQGEVIAYVGSTGYSTGPHLYYEVSINGRRVNPLRIKLAGGRVLNGAVLADFEKRRQLTDEVISASSVASADRSERAAAD